MKNAARQRQLSPVIFTFDEDNICTGPPYLVGLSMDDIADMSPKELERRKQEYRR